jgi:hypothetical protein
MTEKQVNSLEGNIRVGFIPVHPGCTNVHANRGDNISGSFSWADFSTRAMYAVDWGPHFGIETDLRLSSLSSRTFCTRLVLLQD